MKTFCLWNCGDISPATAQLGEHFLSISSDCLCIAFHFTLHSIIFLPPLFSFPQSTLVSSFRVVVNFGCNLALEAHPLLLTLAFWKLAIDAHRSSTLTLRQFHTVLWDRTQPSPLWLTWSTAHNMADELFSCFYLTDFSGLNRQFISDSLWLLWT